MAKGAGTLLLAIHPDDGAMECAHILTKGFLIRPLVLVTVFSQSHHLAESVKKKYSFEIVPQVRLSEDRNFCKAFGLSYLPLGFEDRKYSPLESHFITAQITDSLLKILRSGEYSLVVCTYPNLTSGYYHPHHKLVFEAVVAAVAQINGITLLFTDDQPYSRIPLDAQIICNGIKYVPTIFEMSKSELEYKMEIMGIYKSQMCKEYFIAVSRPAPGDILCRHSESLWIPKIFYRDALALKASCDNGDAESMRNDFKNESKECVAFSRDI